VFIKSTGLKVFENLEFSYELSFEKTSVVPTDIVSFSKLKQDILIIGFNTWKILIVDLKLKLLIDECSWISFNVLSADYVENRLLVSGESCKVAIYENKELKECRLHNGYIWDVSFIGKDKFVTVSDDMSVKTWAVGMLEFDGK